MDKELTNEEMEELAETFRSIKLSPEEEAEASKQLIVARKEHLKLLTPQQILLSRLLQIKYRLEDYEKDL